MAENIPVGPQNDGNLDIPEWLGQVNIEEEKLKKKLSPIVERLTASRPPEQPASEALSYNEIKKILDSIADPNEYKALVKMLIAKFKDFRGSTSDTTSLLVTLGAMDTIRSIGVDLEKIKSMVSVITAVDRRPIVTQETKMVPPTVEDQSVSSKLNTQLTQRLEEQN